MSHPSSTPPGNDPRDTAPGPVADDAAADPERAPSDGPQRRHHINPARMEVRVRRVALLGLVLVPVVYFILQSLR